MPIINSRAKNKSDLSFIYSVWKKLLRCQVPNKLQRKTSYVLAKKLIMTIIAKIYQIFVYAIFFAIIWWNPWQIINFMHIDNSQNALSIMLAIAGILSSILGILVALLLVTFDMLRKYFYNYAYHELFRKDKFRALFFLYIASIVFPIITALDINDSLTSRNINCIYGSMLLFIISIIALYPMSKSILTSSISPAKINKLAESISTATLSQIRNYSYDIRFGYGILDIDKNPLHVLKEIALKNIDEGEIELSIKIMKESSSRLMDIIQNEPSNDKKREYLEEYVYILSPVMRRALKNQSNSLMLTLLSILKQINDYSATNKLPWAVLVSTNKLLRELVEGLIDMDMPKIALYALLDIKEMFLLQLKHNIPEEHDIMMQNMQKYDETTKPKFDSDKNSQWMSISTEYISILRSAIIRAISHKDTSSFSQGLLGLYGIILNVQQMPMGEMQVFDIIGNCYYSIAEVIKEALKADLFNKNYDYFPIGSYVVMGALDRDAKYSKYVLIQYCSIILIFSKMNMLSRTIINETGTIGRRCIDKCKSNKLYVEAVLFICDVFDRIINELEGNESIENRLNYIEIFNQVNSFIKWNDKKNCEDQKILLKSANLLKKFNKISDYKEFFSKSEIRWPIISEM